MPPPPASYHRVAVPPRSSAVPSSVPREYLLPASLFKSPEYALQPFKFLGAHNGASTFRIDPAFFEKYPELYDAQADITAKGKHLKPLGRSQPGAEFFTTNLTLDMLQGYDVPLSFVFGNHSALGGPHYCAQLWVNRWQFGKYISQSHPA
ncbi:uncharacterized protein PV07_08813 [Cladophialophora immunda]|uniref:Beta-galactosidase jelly roll domain-containing protein n=1 Tax=Cladophialophora immunda TaxID=569365 RepID=A0A0D2AKX7_9EURO|nr:uncharacterized protein PV07_08813 [Cladophialophora immunda]KIW25647.1 hypothetical protein PV07_08813 [Cladophialophora immunda]